MAKHKPPKEIIERRESERNKQGKKQKPKIPWKWDWKYWLGTFIAVIGLYITLEARPTVAFDLPLNPYNVMSTPVVLSNDGFLTLDEVQVATYVSDIHYRLSGVQQDVSSEGYFPVGELTRDHKETVPLYSYVGATIAGRPDEINSADVSLIVSYKLEYLPFIKREDAFRFITVRQSDGNLRFIQEPTGDVLERYRKMHGE